MIEYNHKGMTVASLHDERTGSFQYVVVDEATKTAAIIDPVLDFDPRAGATATDNADMILEYVRAKGLTVEWVLDTHPHADHFSAAPYLAEKTGGKTAIGTKVVEVQKLWQDIYCLPDLPVDGSQWDRLFADGEQFRIGSLDAHVMLSPGHTLASITYVVGDAAFVHDTLMVPDSGTSRADFPGGNARAVALDPGDPRTAAQHRDLCRPRLRQGRARSLWTIDRGGPAS
ncbi:hypothetical protein GCM10020258_56340 [Sphingomonas yabuuchiae]